MCEDREIFNNYCCETNGINFSGLAQNKLSAVWFLNMRLF